MNTRVTTNETATLWSVDAIEDMAFIQASNKEAFANTVIGRIGNTYSTSVMYILFGCINTGTGSNYIISAGAVFFNGEIYTVDAVNFTAASTAVATVTDTSNGDIRLFSDNTTKPVTRIRKVVIANGVSGSGDSDFSNFFLLRKNSAYANLAGFTKSIGTGGATLGFPASTTAYIIVSDVDGLINTTSGALTPKAGLYKLSLTLTVSTNINTGLSVVLYKNGSFFAPMVSESINNPNTSIVSITNYAIQSNGTDTYTILITCGPGANISGFGFISLEPTS